MGPQCVLVVPSVQLSCTVVLAVLIFRRNWFVLKENNQKCGLVSMCEKLPQCNGFEQYPRVIYHLCFRSFSDIEKAKKISDETDSSTEQLKKQLQIERTLKSQAVNKLAEIVNRKDFVRENSKKRKAPSDDLRKKEKENRKLHQELRAVSPWVQKWALMSCRKIP